MFKLLAIDLDGTLLNSYGEVSPKTRNALKEAKKQGVEVVLSSGRTIDSVKNLAIELGVDNYLISGNGAVVYDIKNKEIIYNQFLSKEKILQIAKICEENSIYYNIYTETEIVTKSLNYNVLFYYNENLKKPENRRTQINIVTDVIKYIEENDKQRFLKVTICEKNKLIFNSILRKINEIKDLDILEVEYMSRKKVKNGTDEIPIEYFYTEVTNENVNKWTALKYLMDKLNIKQKEVVAIGDNMNDKEMIENSGLGIAMGNSNSKMKEIADIVVKDNNSDGVCEAIQRYIII
ncbi:MAG: Cof-type HAD-IIB family hydrolase [Candidatus Scatovivens sp.]